MTANQRFFLLVVCLAVGLVTACEPLAPEQTPKVIVVTGETPATGAQPDAVLPVAPTSPPEGASVGPAGIPVPTGITGASGVVSTPVPSDTPIPAPSMPPTATPFVCAETTGQVLASSFYSGIVGDQVPYHLYLPPCFFETFRRYPYVILLHGTGFDDSMWMDLGAPELLDTGIADGMLPPMVLVMPDGGELSEINDQPEGASYETVILDELIPALESSFCLWGSRQGRAIGGISRGGFWAFSIAFRHPEFFSTLGGHSPHFEPDNALPENNPLDLAGRVNFDQYPLRIYMDNGTNDYVGANAIRMSDLLRENGVPHDYLINPGGDHDVTYWSAHVAGYLAFYGETWPYDPLALPSCLEPSPE